MKVLREKINFMLAFVRASAKSTCMFSKWIVRWHHNSSDRRAVRALRGIRHKNRQHTRTMKSGSACLYGAVSCSILATLIICVSFSTDYWLQLATPKYNVDSLGLWNVCRKIQEWYGHYRQCFSVLNDRMAPDFFRPPFYVSVQVMFTICLLLAGAVLVLLLVAACCGGTTLIKVGASVLFWSAILGLVALIVFGGCAADFWWITNEDHAFLSWSYWTGLAGVLVEIWGSILYFCHFRKTNDL